MKTSIVNKVFEEICEEKSNKMKESMPIQSRTETFELTKMFPKLDARFADIVAELLELHSKKVVDYGAIGNEDSNLHASKDIGIDPHVGVILRMNDKWRRIKHFIKEGHLENESFEDSLMDLANYSLLALFLYKHFRKKL